MRIHCDAYERCWTKRCLRGVERLWPRNVWELQKCLELAIDRTASFLPLSVREERKLSGSTQTETPCRKKEKTTSNTLPIMSVAKFPENLKSARKSAASESSIIWISRVKCTHHEVKRDTYTYPNSGFEKSNVDITLISPVAWAETERVVFPSRNNTAA